MADKRVTLVASTDYKGQGELAVTTREANRKRLADLDQ